MSQRQRKSSDDTGNVLGQPIEWDFIVRVDRSIKPSYPNEFQMLERPELDSEGLDEYDLRLVGQWLNKDQIKGTEFTNGTKIYDDLVKEGILDSCLGLRDGLAIQQKGIRVFRELFKRRSPFLWASTARYKNGRLFVPFLYDEELKNEVGLFWSSVTDFLHPNCPALHHSK